MSHKATNWAFQQETRTASQKFVLILLADWADETGHAWPHQTTLAEKAMLSVRQLRRILHELEQDMFVRRSQTRRRDGRRGGDHYKLNLK